MSQYEQIETLHPADDLVVGNRSPSLLHSLSEPEFESERVDAVEVVPEEPLVPHEAQVLVQPQRRTVRYLRL